VSVNRKHRVELLDLGLSDYRSALDLQRKIFARLRKGKAADRVIFTRHRPTITMGKSAREEDIFASEEELKKRGVEKIRIERGGGVTYHGPGQVIVYPLFDLRNFGKDLGDFIGKLEETMAQVARSYGIPVERREGEIGLWLRDEKRKLGSIGLSLRNWYSMHGLALNVLPDEKTSLIRPCGIPGAELVSLSAFAEVSLEEVRGKLLRGFADIFNIHLNQISLKEGSQS